MRASRVPILVLVVGALVAAVMVVRSDDAMSSGSSEPPDIRSLAPTVSPEDALSSTWYCAAGSAGDISVVEATEEEPAADVAEDPAAEEPAAAEGEDPATVDEDPEAEPTGPVLAEHTVSIANIGDTDRVATVSIHAGGSDPVVIDVDVPALSTERVALADHAAGPAVAALVEVDGGDVVVSHQLVGEFGIDSGPCASSSSDVWHFAWGDTSLDVAEVIAVFNPFPGDAVVDFTFVNDEGVREPQALTGLVVPGQSVVVADVSAEATRRPQVSATVTARTGRVVAERVQVADGSEGLEGQPLRQGLAVDLGTPVPDQIWVHPDGRLSDGRRQSVVVYNPSDEPAEVDVEIGLGAEVVGGVEPFELSVRPHSFEVVELTEEARFEDLFDDGEGAFSVTVRSVNGVPVVAEVVNTAAEPGWAASAGGNVVGTETVFVEPRRDGPTAQILALLSLDASEATTVTLEVVDAGEREVIDEIVLDPGERIDLTLDDELDDVGVLVVRSSSPVATELVTRWTDPWGLSVRSGITRTDGSVRTSDLLD